MMKRWIQGVVMVGLIAGSLVGCGGGGSTNTLPDPDVRFVNGVPDAIGLDFLLNEEIVGNNIAYLSATPDFEAIEFISAQDDGYDIGIRRTGQLADLDLFSNVFERDTNSLIVAIGLQDPLSEPDKRARLLLFSVERTAPTGNRSRILFLNGFLRSPGFVTPNVTYQSIIPGDPSSVDNPQFQSQNVQYGELRTLTIDSGTRTFIVRRADTDALVQYASAEFTFEPGKIYLAMMTGREANPDVNLQPRIQYIELSTEE